MKNTRLSGINFVNCKIENLQCDHFTYPKMPKNMPNQGEACISWHGSYPYLVLCRKRQLLQNKYGGESPRETPQLPSPNGRNKVVNDEIVPTSEHVMAIGMTVP